MSPMRLSAAQSSLIVDQSTPERLSSARDQPGADVHITVEMLDGVNGGNQGVMVVRDGTLRGD
jgi:hypothetical protein